MASLIWYIRTGGGEVEVPAASGIGFFGPQGYPYPIHTGQYNDTCYIVNAATASQRGAEAMNNKRVENSSVLLWQSGQPNHLQYVPNEKALIHLRFSGDNLTPVGVNNVWFTACNRYSAASSPQLYVYGAELRHTSSAFTLSTQTPLYWSSLNGSTGMNLADSPGWSGQYSSKTSAPYTGLSLVHDWYVCCSVQPSSSGSTNFSFYAQMEYV